MNADASAQQEPVQPVQPVQPLQPRRRVATGPSRPQYLASTDSDRLMMVVTALAAEVSALRDRLDTHEALAALGLPATAAAIEAFAPDAHDDSRREALRTAMLKRVYRVVTEELDDVRQRAGHAAAPWTAPALGRFGRTKGRALSERSEFARTPPEASTAGCP